MRKTIILLAIVILAVAVLQSGAAAPQAKTFLTNLKVGQPVSLTEKDGRFEIGVFPPNIKPLSHHVTEIGPDYVALRDIVGVTDTIIPIFSISSVKVLRAGGN